MGAKNRFKNGLKDQSGTALVVALVMIVVLTFIGLTSIFTATFETSLSGNKRLSTDSFYIAESRTNTAAKAAPPIMDTARDDPSSSPFTVESLLEDGSTLSDAEKNSGLQSQRINRKVTIPSSKLDSLALPSGQSLNDKSTVTIYHSKLSGTGIGGALQPDAYIVDTVGTDQIVSGNKSKIQIRMKVVVHRPKLEESQ